jgi:putative Holliday junction resolvase
MVLEEFAKSLAPSGTLLGLDLGEKTIGLGISDEARRYAVPVKTIARTKLIKDIDALKKIIHERKISGLVLGLPLNMDGSEGPRAQSVRTFASNLRKQIALPLVFWDERLSTFEAERKLQQAGLSPGKNAGKIDASAATIILQAVLDRLQALKA